MRVSWIQGQSVEEYKVEHAARFGGSRRIDGQQLSHVEARTLPRKHHSSISTRHNSRAMLRSYLSRDI